MIHEMIEARDVRMGQWGFSNQVSHHIPYMYDYAGQPYKTQAKVREALRRLYSGSRIGAGYAGDEDNGETSTWYLFASLGFYPLQVGSPYYAVGSPLFDRATVHSRRRSQARRERARQQLAQRLRAGRCGSTAARTTRRTSPRRPRARRDARVPHGPAAVALGHGTLRRAAVDHPRRPAARTAARCDRPALRHRVRRRAVRRHVGHRGDRAQVQYGFAQPRRVTFYTLTNAATGADPRSWALQGSTDGKRWTTLDVRHGETFKWRTQTRPFAVSRPGAYRHYRIALAAPARLAEVELLTRAATPAAPLRASVDAGTGRAGSDVPVRVTVTNTGTRTVERDRRRRRCRRTGG